jgi:hypothetical protein
MHLKCVLARQKSKGKRNLDYPLVSQFSQQAVEVRNSLIPSLAEYL